MSAEVAQGLTTAGFSPAQASFIDRCITWVENVHPEATEADVWMLCTNALIRQEETVLRKWFRRHPRGLLVSVSKQSNLTNESSCSDITDQ